MKEGLTKDTVDKTFGIHPTTAEEFTGLDVTVSSGESVEKSSC